MEIIDVAKAMLKMAEDNTLLENLQRQHVNMEALSYRVSSAGDLITVETISNICKSVIDGSRTFSSHEEFEDSLRSEVEEMVLKNKQTYIEVVEDKPFDGECFDKLISTLANEAMTEMPARSVVMMTGVEVELQPLSELINVLQEEFVRRVHFVMERTQLTTHKSSEMYHFQVLVRAAATVIEKKYGPLAALVLCISSEIISLLQKTHGISTKDWLAVSERLALDVCLQYKDSGPIVKEDLPVIFDKVLDTIVNEINRSTGFSVSADAVITLVGSDVFVLLATMPSQNELFGSEENEVRGSLRSRLISDNGTPIKNKLTIREYVQICAVATAENF